MFENTNNRYRMKEMNHKILINNGERAIVLKNCYLLDGILLCELEQRTKEKWKEGGEIIFRAVRLTKVGGQNTLLYNNEKLDDIGLDKEYLLRLINSFYNTNESVSTPRTR